MELGAEALVPTADGGGPAAVVVGDAGEGVVQGGAAVPHGLMDREVLIRFGVVPGVVVPGAELVSRRWELRVAGCGHDVSSDWWVGEDDDARPLGEDLSVMASADSADSAAPALRSRRSDRRGQVRSSRRSG